MKLTENEVALVLSLLEGCDLDGDLYEFDVHQVQHDLVAKLRQDDTKNQSPWPTAGAFEAENREILAVARQVVRDLSLGWAPENCFAHPKDVCRDLTEILGDTFDYETGE